MSTSVDAHYELISLVQSAPPPGTEGVDWFCYRIRQGINCITGYRRGNVQAVEEAVNGLVSSLNERRSGKRKGPVHLTQLRKSRTSTWTSH
ncbi:MAG: hypothetical protein ACREQZ_00070 [Woeseiaceae bacterium]